MKDSGLRRHSTHSIIEGERRVLQSSAPSVLVSTWLAGAEGGESETLPHSPWAQKALAWEAALLLSFPLLGTSSPSGGGGGEVYEAGRKAGRPAICNVSLLGGGGFAPCFPVWGAGGWLGSLNKLHAIKASPSGRGDPKLCQKGGAAVRGKNMQETARDPVWGTLPRRPISFEDMAGWGV